jgi:hypothetical protein
MKRGTTFAVAVAILGMAAKGLGCTTTVEPIAGAGEEAGPGAADSATADSSSGASSGGSSSSSGGPSSSGSSGSSSSGGPSSSGSSGSSSSGGQSSSGSGGSSSGGYTTLCPVFNGLPTCPAASDANGCNLSLGTNCAADVLPQGLACSGPSQCQARIGPVDGCGRADGWICSCIDGGWSCDDCALGQALCEGGTGAYELPEAGTRDE